MRLLLLVKNLRRSLKYFNINTKLIYNPLNKKEIENKSRERLKFKFLKKIQLK